MCQKTDGMKILNLMKVTSQWFPVCLFVCLFFVVVVVVLFRFVFLANLEPQTNFLADASGYNFKY